MRVVRGNYTVLFEKEPKLGVLSVRGDGKHSTPMDSAIARAICRQYDMFREEFDRALDHASPVEAMRTEARRAGIPLVTFLYGVPENLVEAIEPATNSTIALSLALADMEPEILADLMSLAGGKLPDISSQYLADEKDWAQARIRFAAHVTGMDYGYELMRAGVPGHLFPDISRKVTSDLMVAIIRGVPAPYAASALTAGIELDTVVASYRSGITLEYALALTEKTR